MGFWIFMGVAIGIAICTTDSSAICAIAKELNYWLANDAVAHCAT